MTNPPPHGRTRKLQWVGGKAKAFNGRWYPVEVVLVGPRSVRVVSIAGEVCRDVPIELQARLAAGDTSGDVLRGWLGRAGYRNVKLTVHPEPGSVEQHRDAITESTSEW